MYGLLLARTLPRRGETVTGLGQAWACTTCMFQGKLKLGLCCPRFKVEDYKCVTAYDEEFCAASPVTEYTV